MKEKLKRIAVIGLPGSGKSTFAVRLGAILRIPVHHLDRHMFDGRTKIDMQEFLTIKEALVNESAWIIEGCSIKTLEMRFARADTVIYFHLPRWLCIWRVCKRLFTLDDSIAETGCLNGVNWALIQYIWNFDREKRARIEELRARFPDVDFITFRHIWDPDQYLKNLEGK